MNQIKTPQKVEKLKDALREAWTQKVFTTKEPRSMAIQQVPDLAFGYDDVDVDLDSWFQSDEAYGLYER